MTITKKWSKLKNMMRSTAAESFNFRISIISWRSKHLVGRAKNYWQRREFSQGSWMCAISEPYFYYTAEQTCDFFLRLCCKKSWIANILIPPSITHEKKPCNLIASLCGQRWKGRGRGNLGVREALSPSRVPKFPLPLPLPLPLSTPATQATLLQDRFERGW